MKIGVPKEIKVHEYRVGLVPAGVRELVDAGHQVLVQTGAGAGIGFDDDHYHAAPAPPSRPTPRTVFDDAELVVKVKEPQLAECRRLRPGQIAVHVSASGCRSRPGRRCRLRRHRHRLRDRYRPDGSLPLLTPMSEVAGRMSIQVGANCLQKANGGFGVLLGGVPGVAPAKVVVLGGGVSGTHAAEMAVGCAPT